MAPSDPQISPELRRQLDTAGNAERVEAVLTLRPDQESGEPAEPSAVEETVERVLRRVAEETGTTDYDFNVFGFLESFAVAAEPKFIERLLSQPEVESATPNRPGPES
jgi:hypothetical protein